MLLQKYLLRFPYMEAEKEIGGVKGAEEEKETNEEEQQEETVLEEKEDTVPLATHIALKKQLKEYKKKLEESDSKNLDNELKNEINSLKQKYIEKGYDEDLAQTLAEDFASVKVSANKKKSDTDEDIDDELKFIAKDEYFKDAPVYKKEIQSKIKEFKNKGVELSIEDAYTLVRGKTRIKEIITDREQKNLLDRRNIEEKQVANSTTKQPKNPYPLDEADKKALEGLKKAMPDSNWTAEKYFKMMKE